MPDLNWWTVGFLIDCSPIKPLSSQAVFFPYSVTPDDVRRCSTELFDGEKCHVVLLAANARAQAALMYALRAVINHVRSS